MKIKAIEYRKKLIEEHFKTRQEILDTEYKLSELNRTLLKIENELGETPSTDSLTSVYEELDRANHREGMRYTLLRNDEVLIEQDRPITHADLLALDGGKLFKIYARSLIRNKGCKYGLDTYRIISHLPK